MKKRFLPLLALALLLPQAAQADVFSNVNQSPVTSIGFRPNQANNTNGVLNDFVNNHLLPIIFLVIGAAAVLLLIWAGIQYISSAGNQDATKKARQSIINIVLGIVLLTASYAVISLIIGSLNFLASKFH